MNQTGQNIRILRKNKQLSQKVLAEYLKVAQNTVANYENGKRDPDIETLLSISDFFEVSLDELMGKAPLKAESSLKISIQNESELRDDFLNRILEGNEAEAIGEISRYAIDNDSIFRIFEHVLAPLLVSVGNKWQLGRMNSSWEHYVTSAVDKTISILSCRLNLEPYSDKKAVCLAYSSDPHCIGIKMVAELLKSQGIRVYYLGSNTPTHSLLEMLTTLKPDLLAVSVTLHYHLDGLRNMIQVVREKEELSGMKIVVGGQAFSANPDSWQRTGADAYTRGLFEVLDYI